MFMISIHEYEDILHLVAQIYPDSKCFERDKKKKKRNRTPCCQNVASDPRRSERERKTLYYPLNDISS